MEYTKRYSELFEWLPSLKEGDYTLKILDTERFEPSFFIGKNYPYDECSEFAKVFSLVKSNVFLNIEFSLPNSVTNIDSIFNGTKTILPLKSIKILNPEKITSAYCGFRSCRYLETFDFKGFESLVFASWMLHSCIRLKDLKNLNSISNIQNGHRLFQNCAKIKEADISTWANLKLGHWLFYFCDNLRLVKLPKAFFTNINEFAYMFNKIPVKITIKVGNKDTEKIILENSQFLGLDQFTIEIYNE